MISSPNIRAARAAAGKKGADSRWGWRGASKTIRVDADAADALAAVPERDRRRVASDAIRACVVEYIAR